MTAPPPSRSARQLAALALALVAAGAVLLGARTLLWPDPTHGAEPAPTTTTSTSTTTTTLDPLVQPAPAGPVALPPTTPGLAPVVERVPTTDRVVFLTIDDGHVRDPAALASLTDRRIPFTAFLNLAPAEADPAYWRQALAGGALVEGHTIDHPDLRTLGEAEQRHQLCGTQEAFTALFGRTPTLVRPPFGSYDESARRVALGCGYSAMVMWTGVASEGTLTLQEEALQPGDIILLHWRPSLQADIEVTLARIQAEGFKVGLLEDYLP